MKKFNLKFLLLFLTAFVFCSYPVVLGDWNPGDPFKMHYPQLPKQGGWDVALFSEGSIWLADDWECTQTGPVSDIHFWVSWFLDDVQPIEGFSIRIFSDDPCGVNGWSEPNELLWERDFTANDIIVRPMEPELQGWFDPYWGVWAPDNHTQWSQVNITDIPDPFIQQQGEIYWLMIDVWSGGNIGWKESGSPHFRDDAVYFDGINWIEIRDPDTWESTDLAFVITGEEEEPGIKWEQLYDPYFCGPHAHDYDLGFGYERLIVADDWLCEGGVVTDLHWWGAIEDPGSGLWGFHLSIHANDYIGCLPFDPALWEADIPITSITEIPTGSFNNCAEEIIKYEYILPPEEYFHQEEGKTYWFNVCALSNDPMIPCLWTWQEAGRNPGPILCPAASKIWPDPDIWDPIYWDPNYSDMAFVITSQEEEEPNNIKWIQHPDLEDTGIDVDASIDFMGMAPWANHVLADDFSCTSTEPVTDIHIWGSWYHDEMPFGEPNMLFLLLTIHEDLPVGDPCNPFNYSIPGDVLWVRGFGPEEFDVTNEADNISEGYYFPSNIASYTPDADWTCYRYDFYIDPCEAFIQQGSPEDPCVYWLSIQAEPGPMDPPVRFGWKTSLDHWNDDAVWAEGDPWMHESWQELRYPPGHPFIGESIDLAFAITTGTYESNEPNEPIEPYTKPLAPHTKWSQPPIPIDPNSDIPVYCGWDEPSLNKLGIYFPCWECPTQCHGDADCDGYVGPTDLHILKLAFGTTYPDPLYNYCADFNRDFVVNTSDLLILKLYWLQWPPPDCSPPAGLSALSPTSVQGDIIIDREEVAGILAALDGSGGNGYWDLFCVNLSPNGMYWNLVEGGSGLLTDPLVSPDPSGNSVIDNATPLGGIAYGFGGLDWGNGTLESDVAGYSIQLTGTSDYYLSVVLDSKTTPNNDGVYPSWGTISNIIVTPGTPGNWGAPIVPDWVISPFDPDGGTVLNPGVASSITLASNDFADLEHDTQAGNSEGIWGAAAQLPPAAGYKVDFDVNVITWDSYGVGDVPPPLPTSKWNLVADDFRCLGTMPVTSVHWLGSFIGWDGNEPPPVEPNAWRIGVWSNVPAGINAEFSHPEKLLWQIEVDVNETGYPMISYWKFNENTGSTAGDSANGNDGTIYGATWTTGKDGSALYFHGGGQTAGGSDVVTVPHSANMDITGPFTVEAWIKAVGTDKYHMIADKYDGGPKFDEYGFSFYLTDGNLRLSVYSGANGSGDMAVPIIDLRDNVWHHVTGVWDGSFIKLYIDGAFKVQKSWAYPPSSTTNPLAIGKRYCGWGGFLPFEGTIDEVAIYDSALDPNEIKKHYEDGYPGPDYNVVKVGNCYQYNLNLEPNDYFWQNDYIDETEDNVFWLSIAAIYPNDVNVDYPWGWHTRPSHWMDDAVRFVLYGSLELGMTTETYSIEPLKDNQSGESYDTVFELDTDPNYIKWEQLYTGIHNWPHYEDVMSSQRPGPPGWYTFAADDWRCLRRTPVTAIVWWGSYIDYQYQACIDPLMPEPVKPDYFRLSIYTDVPAGADSNYPFSHPGEVIWEYMAYDFDEVQVGFDKHPEAEEPYRSEPVFRYSVRLPRDAWFNQPNYNDVYWLAIQAVYTTLPDPYYDWGWTNHEHVFNDNSVQWFFDSGFKWQELLDQTGAGADMSFILFTDPNECVSCADYNISGLVEFKDYAVFALDWMWTGASGGYANGDLDCDGKVNYEDLKIFCDQWLQNCP